MIRINRLNLLAGMGIFATLLTSCLGPRKTQTATVETDDVYFSSQDRKAEKEAELALQRMREEENTQASQYEETREEKYSYQSNFREDGPGSYEDDDYYYSRRIRRFSNSGMWNYYDPYFAYDPYYSMNTPYWGSYSNNNPWWYDPWSYNGPSYSWSMSWGMGYGNPYSWWSGPGYYNYPSYYWSSWNNYCYSCNFYNTSYYGYGYGYDPYWYGYNNGYWYGYNSGYNGGYWGCPTYGGWGGGWYSGGNSSSGSTYHVGPRHNPSTLNTSNHPTNEITVDERPLRPYQGLTTSGYYQGDPNGIMAPPSGNQGQPNSVSTPGRNPSSGNVVTDEPVRVTQPANTNPGRNQTQPAGNATTRPTETRPSDSRNNTVTPRNERPATTQPNERPTYIRPNDSRPPQQDRNNSYTPQRNDPPPRQESRPQYTPPPSHNPGSSSPSRENSNIRPR